MTKMVIRFSVFSCIGLLVVAVCLYCLRGGKGGELTFDSTLKEVTTRPDVRVLRVPFNFQNTSDEAIKIVEYDAPCICMDAKLMRADEKKSFVFQPGEKGTVIGVLDFEKLKGKIDKVIKIRTDKDKGKDPSIVLTARVTIPELIESDTNAVRWTVGDALEAKFFMIKVTDKRETPIRVARHSNVFGSSKVFKYEVEALNDGRDYKVTVTPLKTDTPVMESLRFYTDSKIPRYHSFSVGLIVDHPKK